jgi:predicted DNA-binding transcriptional regulator AlpA
MTTKRSEAASHQTETGGDCDPAYYDLDRMLSVNDVMHLLGISRAYLYTLVKRGELRPMRFARVVRYRRGDVLSFCRERMPDGTLARLPCERAPVGIDEATQVSIGVQTGPLFGPYRRRIGTPLVRVDLGGATIRDERCS